MLDACIDFIERAHEYDVELSRVRAKLRNSRARIRNRAYNMSDMQFIKRFYRKFRMPGLMACIDGTHVAILKPNKHEERFYNRKGYHSLNVSIICDSNLNIISVDASYPGATHDSVVWANHPKWLIY
ncbi:hypothetical protein evm_013395 [Chilo suppressalis]|nr:hypothetical protein evm_013395 [Chilo suppressalis]